MITVSGTLEAGDGKIKLAITYGNCWENNAVNAADWTARGPIDLKSINLSLLLPLNVIGYLYFFFSAKIGEQI